MSTIGQRLALQTAARRRGNGFVSARVCCASNGITSRFGTHVVCSWSHIDTR